MATYLELKQKAEKLMAEAEQMRVQETGEVIADIKEKIKAYGLQAQDLGFAGTARKRAPAGAGKSNTVKYRNATSQTWSGGRGRKPQWVTDALKAGRKIEDFAV